MKIKIIFFGKIKNKSLKELFDYYTKLMSKFYKLEVINLKDIADRKVRITDINKYLNNFSVILSEDGKSLDSTEFSNLIKKCRNDSLEINFIIANAFGFEQEVKNKSNLNLSLSKMTFPHEIALMLLSEQLYRSSTILLGTKYHK